MTCRRVFMRIFLLDAKRCNYRKVKYDYKYDYISTCELRKIALVSRWEIEECARETSRGDA